MSASRLFIYFSIFAAGLTALLIVTGPKALQYPAAMEYADLAREFSRGEKLTDRAAWVYQLSLTESVPPPAIRRALGFPLAESGMFRLFGASDLVARATSALFFFLAAIALFQLALHVVPGGHGVWLAAAAGLLLLFDPESLSFAVSGLSESMFTFTMLLMLCFVFCKPFAGRWLLVGLLAGASQSIRLNGFTLIVPVLVACRILDRESFRKNALLAAMGWAVPLVAIAWRNAAAAGIFSFVGVNGAIVFNELGGFDVHGIERRLYLPPAEPPSLLWIVQGHLGEFLAKMARGLNANLIAALTSASPLAWGAAALGGIAGRERLDTRVAALAGFTFSAAAIWIAIFSVGEFEGHRFYVPLVPLVLLLAVTTFYRLARTNFLALGTRLAAFLLAAAIVFPGLYRLVGLLGPDDSGRGPLALGRIIQLQTPPEAVILSDLPWAVAWYGDRASVWLPRTVDEVPALKARAGATHLLLTSAGVPNSELDERWRDIFYSRRGVPAAWRELSTEPLAASLALFEFDD